MCFLIIMVGLHLNLRVELIWHRAHFQISKNIEPCKYQQRQEIENISRVHGSEAYVQIVGFTPALFRARAPPGS